MDEQREQFEAWLLRRQGPTGDTPGYPGSVPFYHDQEAAAWEGWQAATQRQQERIAALEAQVQALSLDAFAKDASIGHLSRLVDAERTDAARYQWLRERDLETISHGGVFAGKTPDNLILNGDDLDRAIDAAIAAGKGEG